MASETRATTAATVALLTTSSSPEIDISKYAWGEVAIPTGSAITTLTYYIAMPSGTLFAAYDSTGSAVAQTVAADRAYPIPAAVFGAAIIQIRASSAGNVKISLKS